jgi:hypothetical protein
MEKPNVIQKTFREVIQEDSHTKLVFGKRFFVGELHYLILTFLGTLLGCVIVMVFISVR